MIAVSPSPERGGREIFSGRVKRDLRYSTKVALHLADLVNEVHSRGLVIGDISGTNLMADSDGFCTIVDVDSFGADPGDGKPVINAFGDPQLDGSKTDNQPGLHEVMEEMRPEADKFDSSEFPGTRVLIGETYLPNIGELKKCMGRWTNRSSICRWTRRWP